MLRKTILSVLFSATCALPMFAAPMITLPMTANATEVEFLNSETNRAMGYPFSEAVRVGHMLFLSGQVGEIPGNPNVVPGGIQAETRQTMTNIKAVLEKNGSSMAEVVKCTVFIEDMSEWSAMNEVYITFFEGNPPARSAVGANGLALGAKLEIECIATVGLKRIN